VDGAAKPGDTQAMTSASGTVSDGLLAIEDAAARARALVKQVGETECVPLADALGRILAEPVRARGPLPAFDNAAVDGYAFASERLSVRPPPFAVPIIDRVAAGEVPCQPNPVDGAVRIFTGAAVPAGFDTVVMQEHCERRGDVLTVARQPSPGANVRLRGEDVETGEDVLAAGLRIDARHIALAAAVGVSHVVVRRPLRAAVLSIGNEIRDVGERLGPATIYDSNRPMLAAVLAAAGVNVSDLGVVGDDPARLAAVVGDAADAHDLIVSTGGISVGDEDHVAAVMASLCDRHERLWMAVKPGKPAALGSLSAARWLGLPGNAFAAFVAFLVLGRPIVRALMGSRDRVPSLGCPAAAAFEWSRTPGRDEFFPARHVGFDDDDRPRVERLGRGGSARLRPLADADGLAMVAADVAEVQHGSRLTYLPFSEAWSR
jgi:molybdopterin molybdotransferase